MNNRGIIAVILAAVVIIGGFIVLNAPDQRSTGDKVGDAIDQLDEGVDDAARELKDRTPIERIKDEVNDAKD